VGRLAVKAPLLLAAALLCLAAAAQGQGASPGGIIELRDGTRRADVLPYCLTAAEDGPLDAPSRLSFRPDLSRFEAPGPGAFRGFVRSRATWICFTLRSAASARSWLIDAGPNRGDAVSLYVVDSDGGVESQVMDPTLRSSAGIQTPSEYAFRLTVGPGQLKTVYLRFSSDGLYQIKANVWDSFEYIKTDEVETCFAGIVLGVILAVFIYTLFIAISLREGSYGFYLAYLFGFLVFVIAESGAGQAFVWPGSSWIGQRIVFFFMLFMDFGIALFARDFLGLARRSPALSGLLSAVAGLALLGAAGLAIFDLRWATRAALALDALARFAVLAAALASLRAPEGASSRRAGFFAVSYSLAFAGGLAVRLAQLGVLPGLDSLWATGEEYGAFAQVLLLSYGITDAINSMRTEKEEGQRRSIELLERANKVKEDFVIGTSLEFRSPLFGIVGLVDALEERAAEGAGPEERRLSALIKAEALRLLGSVANIAAYARLRNGDMALAAESVSLREVVEGVAGSASHIASGKDIAVETAVEDAEIGTDARVLEQIVYNLFADALKRSSSGVVRMEGGPQGAGAGGRIRIAVSDSAPPLPEEQLARFLSEGGSSDREAVGPGLELLVARLLAERLGGSLSYSWAGGSGRFALDLPRAAPWRADGRSAPRGGIPSFLGRLSARTGRPVAADLSETPPGRASRGIVLAYDEDPVFLEALKRYLEGRGYAVAPALSADKAVALASARPFDLVLLDASGQGRAGLSACSRIRAARGMDELPVVVMTDRESAEAVEAAFRAGATDCLTKLSPNELLFARVDTLVALRRAMADALETRRRVAELEKLKTLGVLAAGVAHEVNTPNNAIIRNLPVVSEVWRELSPIVRRHMDESEGFSIRGWTAEELMRELPELLADTYSAGLQIKKIVEDLKDYARDSSASPPEPVDLSAVAAYASRLLAPLIGRSTGSFALDAPAGLPPAKANFQKLTQVAVSVLENALQSLSGPGAAVALRTRFEADRARLVLECEDEGSGIHPALLDKVFEPFFTTKREAGGTGLGLSVAMGIVQDAGGAIEIDSRPGRGTTVRVVLPAILATGSENDERSE
jgi:signal transduction histidine kinase